MKFCWPVAAVALMATVSPVVQGAPRPGMFLVETVDKNDLLEYGSDYQDDSVTDPDFMCVNKAECATRLSGPWPTTTVAPFTTSWDDPGKCWSENPGNTWLCG